MDESTGKHDSPATPLWEKLTGAIGFIFICFTLGFLIWSASQAEEHPPEIVISVTDIRQINDGFLVVVRVKNSGTKTAADLNLSGTLSEHGSETETVAARIDFLPPNSSKMAGFFFTKDPSQGTLKFRPLGYQEP